jgi:hypothetical protein
MGIYSEPLIFHGAVVGEIGNRFCVFTAFVSSLFAASCAAVK